MSEKTVKKLKKLRKELENFTTPTRLLRELDEIIRQLEANIPD